MPDSTNLGITYPLPGDLVRNPSVAAKLASDMGTLARTADDAIRAGDAALRGEVGEVRANLNMFGENTQAALDQQRTDFEAALDSIETAYDVAVADGYTGTITEWLESLVGPRGPEGPYGGTEVTDPQVASYVTDGGTETHAALAETMVARGTVLHDVRDYGAVGDNATDDSPAFQAAIAAAKASGGRAYAWGTFRVEEPIRIDSHADFSNAVVNYHGPTDGTAFTVTGWRLDVSTPSVYNGLKEHGGGWDGVAGSVGVQMLNCNGCTVHVKFVQNFEHGLSVYGSNTGSAYNTISLGWLFNCKKGVVLDTYSSTGVGYSNQNTYIGGRISGHAAEGANVPGMVGLYLTGPGDGGPNNNLFLNTCLEGAQQEYAFDIDRGKNNRLVNARLEYGNAIRFGTLAKDNEVEVGYSDGEKTAVHDETEGFGNTVRYHRFQYVRDAEHYYHRGLDSQPWMRFASGQKRLFLGPGNDVPPTAIRGGTGYIAIDGSVRPEQNGTVDLGGGENWWRNVYATGRGRFNDGVDYAVASGQAPAAAGLARTYVIVNESGKMEFRLRWPGGSFTTLATEP